MKHIDPVKFREALNKFKAEIKPSEKDIKASSLSSCNLLERYRRSITCSRHCCNSSYYR